MKQKHSWLIMVNPDLKLAFQYAKRGTGRSIRFMIERALYRYLEEKHPQYLEEAREALDPRRDLPPLEGPPRNTPLPTEDDEE